MINFTLEFLKSDTSKLSIEELSKDFKRSIAQFRQKGVRGDRGRMIVLCEDILKRVTGICVDDYPSPLYHFNILHPNEVVMDEFRSHGLSITLLPTEYHCVFTIYECDTDLLYRENLKFDPGINFHDMENRTVH